MRQFASHGFDLTWDRPIRVALLRLRPASARAGREHPSHRRRRMVADPARLRCAVRLRRALAPGLPRRVIRCRCSTPTTPCGSGSCWTAITGSAGSSTGVERWTVSTARRHSPSDRPTSTSQRAGVVDFEVSAGVQQAVHHLAAQHHATPFMVLHAALSVVLSRHGAQPDVVVATAVAGRGERVLDSLVGMFVNTLALRAQVQPDMPFTGLLAQVRDFDVDAFEHADVPFEVGGRAARRPDPAGGAGIAEPADPDYRGRGHDGDGRGIRHRNSEVRPPPDAHRDIR